jgi:hypothetical protein
LQDCYDSFGISLADHTVGSHRLYQPIVFAGGGHLQQR